MSSNISGNSAIDHVQILMKGETEVTISEVENYLTVLITGDDKEHIVKFIQTKTSSGFEKLGEQILIISFCVGGAIMLLGLTFSHMQGIGIPSNISNTTEAVGALTVSAGIVAGGFIMQADLLYKGLNKQDVKNLFNEIREKNDRQKLEKTIREQEWVLQILNNNAEWVLQMPNKNSKIDQQKINEQLKLIERLKERLNNYDSLDPVENNLEQTGEEIEMENF